MHRLVPGALIALAALALGSAAGAQPRITPAAPPADIETPIPSIAEDRAANEALTAQLTALDAELIADETRMTGLRDAELAKQNARIRAIRPALAFHGRSEH